MGEKIEVLGEARYEQGALTLESPLELPEGARLLIVRLEGALILLPTETDVSFLRAVEDSIRNH